MPILELDEVHTLNRKVARSEEVHEGLKPYAEEVLAAVIGVAARHSVTGAYADSWHLEEGIVDWHIVSDDPHALSKEYGRSWASEHEGEGPLHTQGVHALSTVLGEFGGSAA
jgi:hypothetical protein